MFVFVEGHIKLLPRNMPSYVLVKEDDCFGYFEEQKVGSYTILELERCSCFLLG